MSNQTKLQTAAGVAPLKVEIHFFPNVGNVSLPCAAKADFEGVTYYGIGETWNMAASRLQANLKSAIATRATVPPPQVVEIVS